MTFDNPKRPLLGDHKKSTTELLGDIRSIAKGKSRDEFNFFMQRNQNEFSYDPQVGKYIKDVLGERWHNLKISELAKTTGISKSYLYQLIPAKETPPKTVKNNPDRKMLLAIAIALHFSVDETQHLLKYAKEPELYPRNSFDSTIIYALECGCSIIETNILLENLNCELLIFGKDKQAQDD